jgi:hypothetical protein
VKLSKHDIAAIGTLVGKDYQKPGKPRTTGMTKAKKDRLFESAYQLYKELQGQVKRKGVGSNENGFCIPPTERMLHCPNCCELYGKAKDNPKFVTCGVCGYRFPNRSGWGNSLDASVNSNPSWVADHDIWLDAKAKAPGAPWGVITNIYKAMGGRVFTKKDFANQVMQQKKAQAHSNKMKTAGVLK